MTANPGSAPPSLTAGNRSGSFTLERRSILLAQGGVRRRIPLEAIEVVRMDDGARRSAVQVVLTAPAGTPGTVFRVGCRNAASATAFVEAAGRALPVREADAPREDGGARVVVLPPAEDRDKRSARDWLVIAALLTPVALYVAGLVVLIVHGDVLGVIFWILGLKPLAFGLILYGTSAKALYDRWLLRRRGISVVATFDHTDGKKQIFGFVDADGVRRFFEPDHAAEPVGLAPRGVAAHYDPRHVERVKAVLPVRTWVLRTIGVAFGGTFLLVIGFFLVPYQLIDVLSR
ncbi:hypothetical protein [Streptomyces sp. NBC_00059]|uniref:hypothetical protein n=1 Tax=Streptomyces sp. NBC_00059 TaxID=2975635 RepID=UPI00224E1E30|nr:hypothetical protein [Streptomyces sp. NBC_00059]MCX5416844.1 hypothetical protein [Streptomyces sp. NBC_00059]